MLEKAKTEVIICLFILTIFELIWIIVLGEINTDQAEVIKGYEMEYKNDR